MPDALIPLILVTPILLLLALGIVGFVVRYQRRLLQQQLEMQQMHEAAQQQALEAALLAQEEEIVYRVVQELLGNGLRHAHASHIAIEVEFGPDYLALHYADDGIGFDPTLPEHPPSPGTRTGLGLTNLRSRVGVLRGTLKHESAPGQGTRVWISLPIPHLSKTQPVTAPAL